MTPAFSTSFRTSGTPGPPPLIAGEACFLVGRLGIEPRTSGLKIRCSNQLSYRPVEARFLAQTGWGAPPLCDGWERLRPRGRFAVTYGTDTAAKPPPH